MKTIPFLLLSVITLFSGSLFASHPSYAPVDPVREEVVALGNAVAKLELSNRRGFEATARTRASTRAEVDFRHSVLALDEAACVMVRQFGAGNTRHTAASLAAVCARYEVACNIANHVGLGDTTKGYLRQIGRAIGNLERVLGGARYHSSYRAESSRYARLAY
jgi:hypothetical protein